MELGDTTPGEMRICVCSHGQFTVEKLKKCYLPPKKCYSVYESVWEGSNIFARRVTVDEYKVPSKMSTNTSLVRTPSTDSHVEGVLRHHPCYFSNISAIFHWYTQSMVTLNVTTK